MRSTRIFTPEALGVGAEVRLTHSAAAHVSRVLRMQADDTLILFDGRGGEYTATLVEVRGPTVRARVDTHKAVERESPLQLTLAQGVARGERMDWVVQKATELGVAAIVPVLTERSVVKLDAQQAAKKVEHWRGIAVAACEQCGRNRIPDIMLPQKLLEWLTLLPEEHHKLLLDPVADKTARELALAGDATLLIGPEGGLSDRERDEARSVGFEGLKLGPRILRTETAGITAIALLQAQFGDL